MRTFKSPIKQLDAYQYLLGLIFLIKYLGSTRLDKTQGLSISGEKAEVYTTEAVTFFHVALFDCVIADSSSQRCYSALSSEAHKAKLQ